MFPLHPARITLRCGMNAPAPPPGHRWPGARGTVTARRTGYAL